MANCVPRKVDFGIAARSRSGGAGCRVRRLRLFKVRRRDMPRATPLVFCKLSLRYPVRATRLIRLQRGLGYISGAGGAKFVSYARQELLSLGYLSINAHSSRWEGYCGSHSFLSVPLVSLFPPIWNFQGALGWRSTRPFW